MCEDHQLPPNRGFQTPCILMKLEAVAASLELRHDVHSRWEGKCLSAAYGLRDQGSGRSSTHPPPRQALETEGAGPKGVERGNARSIDLQRTDVWWCTLTNTWLRGWHHAWPSVTNMFYTNRWCSLHVHGVSVHSTRRVDRLGFVGLGLRKRSSGNWGVSE